MVAPREKPLRSDRILYLLILCLVTGCVLWVQVAVQGLKVGIDAKENNLHDFLILSQGVTSTTVQDPEKAAARFSEVFAGRSWESTLGDLQPKIVITPSGPLLRLVKPPKEQPDEQPDQRPGERDHDREGDR